MKASQRLALELSELRQKINERLGVEAMTDEQRSELEGWTNRAQAAEVEYRAAVVAEDESEQRAASDGEGAELRALVAGSNVGSIFAAAVDHRQTDGRTAELQQHHGLAPNAIPLELLRDEQRAVTPAPANVGASEQPVVLPIFAEGDAAFLGVDMPTVPAGEAVFPVLGTRPTVGGPHTDSTEVAETTGAFTAEALSPGRLQASFFYKRTDAAKFAGMADSLRQALNLGLSEALDKETLDQIVTDVARTDAAAKDTFSTYRTKLVYGRIDGRHANVEGDVRVLVGSGTLANMAGAYRANSADDSAVDSIRRVSGGLRVSPHIAAVAGNKQDAIVRLGMRRDAVAPLWQGVALIPDEVTKAATGEIVVTAVLLAAFKVIRSAAFARMQTQHA